MKYGSLKLYRMHGKDKQKNALEQKYNEAGQIWTLKPMGVTTTFMRNSRDDSNDDCYARNFIDL